LGTPALLVVGGKGFQPKAKAPHMVVVSETARAYVEEFAQ
jgi:hypothetical protein